MAQLVYIYYARFLLLFLHDCSRRWWCCWLYISPLALQVFNYFENRFWPQYLLSFSTKNLFTLSHTHNNTLVVVSFFFFNRSRLRWRFVLPMLSLSFNMTFTLQFSLHTNTNARAYTRWLSVVLRGITKSCVFTYDSMYVHCYFYCCIFTMTFFYAPNSL